MFDNDNIFNKIAEALLIDYTSVYYINAVTNEYQWYSINPDFHSLKLEQGGDDFFKNLIRDAKKVVYKDDLHIFTEEMQKDKLLENMKNGIMQNIVYRLMIDGRPVYHTLRLIHEFKENDDYFIIGVLNIDKEFREKEETERIKMERRIYNQIAESLAEHYDTLYYINTETNEYFEFSSTDVYKSLNIPTVGNDFFKESAKNIPVAVHPEDRKKVLALHKKSNMLKNLEHQKTYSSTYRLIINGEVMHCRNTQIWASDKKHIIVCIENINAEVIAEKAFMESQRNSITYNAIAETLASHYDIIFYINIENEDYAQYTTNNIYGNLEIVNRGEAFFSNITANVGDSLHPEDKDRVLSVLTKDYLISSLDNAKQYSMDYRLIVDGETQYTRLTVMFSSDHLHFIIGIENVTEEILKEEEHLLALKTANEMARRDELTGAKNKNAYKELEASIQKNMETGTDFHPFAFVVCDLNNLKRINDTMGHKAGDEYICSACQMIFDTFSHSPVFRIGGDEFIAVLTERDYADKDHLLGELRRQILDNRESGNGPVIATGMAVYDARTDLKVTDVFDRADNLMYKNKKELKGEL